MKVKITPRVVEQDVTITLTRDEFEKLARVIRAVGSTPGDEGAPYHIWHAAESVVAEVENEMEAEVGQDWKAVADPDQVS